MASSNFPNMSYCMFENTCKGLDQILDHVNERGWEDIIENLNSYEKPYMLRLLKRCATLAADQEEVNEWLEEIAEREEEDEGEED